MDLTQTTHRPSAPWRPSAGLAFLQEATRTQRLTGAIAPSSRRLATRLAVPLRDRKPSNPAAILEVGAGTGTVTRALARLVGPADQLDVVEVNPSFVRILTESMETDPDLSGAAPQIRLVPESITDMHLAPHSYDVIVSCLPFANFEPDVVESIFERYLSALTPGGHLTYFRYLGTQVARTVFSRRTEITRHRAVTAVMEDFEHRYGVHHSTVWGNLPPAQVQTLRAPAPRTTPPAPVATA
ncbi:class I SAM-dependent methyltransferase [Streptomyces auratus]|uniref:Methyltransferase domain-containing protein n=1 Tax=Streptomyces auratus AGR0001 TaxID=1160718 RepID=J2JZG4_9ACTN|nr:methyltransferase domain-containing protein [Streptomyces auratus]QTZ92333.1 methyltransferase domain-containing protein [Streptomyces auratus AGR0001]